MAIDTTTIQEFTYAELLKINLKAQAEIMTYGSSVGSGGKNLSRADLTSLRAGATELRELIAADDAAASGNGGGIALVRFGDAT